MIEQSIVDYVNTYFLKKDEKVDLHSVAEGSLVEIPVVKSTKRTLRMTAILTIGIAAGAADSEIDPRLKSLKWTPNKKLELKSDDPLTLKWLEEGWIIREIRFKQDGKTVNSIYYRMGYRLFKYEHSLLLQQEKELKKELMQLEQGILQTIFPKEYPFVRKRMLEQIKEKVRTMSSEPNLAASTHFLKTWPLKKRMKFLHFILALLQISSSKEHFDWKEIGAVYYKKIGGSKEFDRNKEEFLEQFEVWSSDGADEFGLVSLGRITPVYFSGRLKGTYASYEFGPRSNQPFY